MKNYLLHLIFCISAYFSANAQAVAHQEPQQLSDSAIISVYTCGVGDQLYSLFGHTALRVKDEKQNIDLVFNYGMFDFSTPNFYGKFVKGDLYYSLGIDHQRDFIFAYTQDNRTITEQILDLSTKEKQSIWNALWQQFHSKERYYLYKFIRDNCTTRIHDLIEKHTHYQIKKDFPSNQKTYRQILNDYLQWQYFPQLGINLVFGENVDTPNELLFLPQQFLEGIHLTNQLQKDVKIWYTSTKNPNDKKQPERYLFWLGLAVFGWLGQNKQVRNIYYIIATLLGGLILALQPYSLHEEILNNKAFLIFSPLFFILLFLSSKRRRQFVIFQFIFSILTIFGFLSKEKILIIMPLLLLHFTILTWEIFNKNRKILK